MNDADYKRISEQDPRIPRSKHERARWEADLNAWRAEYARRNLRHAKRIERAWEALTDLQRAAINRAAEPSVHAGWRRSQELK
jgi:hypothetical protein